MSKFSEKDVINYVDGEMEATEVQAFEEALRQDTALQADLALYQSVKGTLKTKFAAHQGDAEFKATLAQFTQQHFNHKQTKPQAKVVTFSKIWYAAAILVIGLLVWAPWNKNLYERYADTEMVSFAERGNSEQVDLQQATDAFNKSDFDAAKHLLEPALAADTANDMLRFYLGVAQLETNAIKAARANLTTVYQKQSLLKFDAAFYMALSYLKEKNKGECKVWLNKIPKDAAVYDKAQELLNAL